MVPGRAYETGKNIHEANVLNHCDAPRISGADANFENTPSICQAFTNVRLEKERRHVHAVCGLWEGKLFNLVLAKEGSTDHASSPLDGRRAGL